MSSVRPSWRSPRAWTALVLATVFALAVDLGSKAWAFDTIAGDPVVFHRHIMVANPGYTPVPRHEPRVIIPDLVDFRLAMNRGAVFGFGANQRGFFFAFTAVAFLGGVLFFTRRTDASEARVHIALGLAIGGGLGNLYDRLAFAAVRDFIHLLPGRTLPGGRTWPGGNPELAPWVFNVADVALLVGMLWLVWELRRRRALLAYEAPGPVVAEA